MAQIIPRSNFLGESLERSLGPLGGGISQGISTGLQSLANLKLQQMAQRQQQSRFQEALGATGQYSPEESNLIGLFSSISPEAGLKIAQALGQANPQGYAQQPMPAIQQVSNVEQAPQQQPAEMIKPLLQAQLQKGLQTQFGAQPAQQQYQNALMASVLGKPASQYTDILKTLNPAQIQHLSAQMAEAGVKPQQAVQQQMPQTMQLMAPQVQMPLENMAPTAILQQRSLRQALANYETPQMKLQRELAEKNMTQKERKEEQRRLEEAYKLTAADRKEIRASGQTAKRDLQQLERMEELEQTGKLDTPGYVELLKRTGFDIPTLMNPESQEFQKLAMSFIRDAKSAFGSRVSNFELESFLKTIPALSQSPSGRKSVIANLKLVARAKADAYDVMRDIMKENNKIPPLDLADQVDDKIDKRMNHYAKKFREDLAKKVPAAQNRLITAGQGLIGTLGGAITGIAGLPTALGKGIGGIGGGGTATTAAEVAAL